MKKFKKVTYSKELINYLKEVGYNFEFKEFGIKLTLDRDYIYISPRVKELNFSKLEARVIDVTNFCENLIKDFCENNEIKFELLNICNQEKMRAKIKQEILEMYDVKDYIICNPDNYEIINKKLGIVGDEPFCGEYESFNNELKYDYISSFHGDYIISDSPNMSLEKAKKISELIYKIENIEY